MRRVRDVMGMPVTADLRDERPDAAAALDALYAELERIDAAYSPFRGDSLVSRVNAGALDLARADGELADVVALCRRYEAATDGYFSAWRGARFDPSGLVKGWAIDRACRILDARGFARYFVDAAGDVRTRGERAPGEPWRIGIRHPVERDKVARVVLAYDLAVATSGTYERGAHIDDPHTGRPATELLSLTVVGPDIVVADVYATAAFAMGRRALDFIAARDGYEAYAIDPDLRATWTGGFEAYCEKIVA
ncbi:MAG: FAD:protein FMN transferase [Chloroflexota bacterium]|nr:FAD:protein FMN transferase [Chloroflexota bacterium]